MKFLFGLLLTLFSLNLVDAHPTLQTDSNDINTDPTLQNLNEDLPNLTIEMESWNSEEIKQFKERFIYKRGHIKIPKEPIPSRATALTDLQLESGCPYFRFVNTSAYPLIARGPIANLIIYCASQIQDTVMTKAYNNGIPFTGLATNTDSSGHLLGKYVFKDGLIQKIEEFTPEGMILKSLNFINGLAHGENKEYNSNGSLRFLFTYNHGQRDGKFYTVYYTDDPNCRTSITEGYYNCGDEVVVSKRCE